MIIGAGQNAASLARASTYPPVKLASTAGAGSVQPTATLGGTNSKGDEALQVGFGDNTLSGIGAALRTIGGGLESARLSVPSLEQIQAQQQAARAQERLAAAQQAAPAAQSAPQIAENTNSKAVQATPKTANESQAMQIGPQTTAATEKTPGTDTSGNQTFALYSRRSETTQVFSTGASAPKLDVKA